MRVLVFLLTLWLALPVLADDRGVLQAFLEDNLSSAGREVRITGFEGALSSTATIEALTIADDQGIWLRLNDVRLNWSRAALLRGRLEVSELSAQLISLPRLPQSPAADPARAEARAFALPELPVAIQIGSIAADRVQLGAPVLGQAAVLRIAGSGTLADGAGLAALRLERLEGPKGTFTLDTSYANETTQLQLDLSLDEAQGGIAATLLGIPEAPPLALNINGDAPLATFQARLELSTDGEPRVTGRLQRRDEADARVLSVQLGGDLRPLFASDLRPFFGDAAQFELTVEQDAQQIIRVPTFRLETQQFLARGGLELGSDRLPRQVKLEAMTVSDEAVTLPMRGPRLAVRTARISFDFDAARSRDWRLSGVIEGLQRDGNVIDRVNLEGRGVLDIARQHAAGSLSSQLEGLAFADAGLQAAIGSLVQTETGFAWQAGAPLQLDGVKLTSGRVQITAQGTVEGAQISGSVAMDAADLSRFAALADRPISGRAAMDLTGAYNLLSGAFDVELGGLTDNLRTGVPQIDGLMRGVADMTISARRDASGTDLRRLQVASTAAAMSARGSLNASEGQAELRAELFDLAVIDPRANGPGRLLSEVYWMAGQPVEVVSADLSAMGATLTGTGHVLQTPHGVDGRGIVDLQVSDLSRFADLAGRGLQGELSAQAKFRVDGADGAITLTANGRDLSAGLADLDILTRGSSSLTATAIRQDGRLAICEAELTTPELSAELRCDSADAISLNARLRSLAVLVPELPGQIGLVGSAQRSNTFWQVDADIAGPVGSTLSLQGQIDPELQANNLRATGDMPLGLLNPMIAPQSVQGRALLDLQLQGAPSLGALSGRISTRGARLALPDAQVTLQGIDARADIQAGTARIAASAGLSQGGRVTATGQVSMANNSIDLTVSARDARLRRDPLFDATADADLQVRGPVQTAVVSGVVTVQQAELRVLNGTSAPGGYIPDGLRHVGASPAVRRSLDTAGLNDRSGGSGGRALGLDVVLNAPARVFIRGRGLDAELGGQLRLGGTTANVVPAGQFSLIRGRLDLLGRRLTMQEAEISLQGALEPHLYLLATARADEFDVSVALEGPASAPRLRLGAEPSLPEDEALALLLFGKRLETLSPLQAAQLAGAVSTLAGRGGDGIVGRLRLGFGLDDLDITSDGDGGTALSAGKYLSDNIYTDVAIGSSGQSQINLNLDLLPNVTATGRLSSDGQSGIGLFWQRDY